MIVAKKKEIIKKAEVIETAPAFTKQQFLMSTKYRQYRDYLTAALDDNNTYTKEQVNEMINNFYKKGGK